MAANGGVAVPPGVGSRSLAPPQAQETTQEQEQRQQHAKTSQGMFLLFLSAFLFSFMGLFLQFTGRMGLPSNEMVFIRALFQGVFVIAGMIFCRVDESPSPSSNDAAVGDNERGTGGECNGVGSGHGVGPGMVLVHEGLEEEKMDKSNRHDAQSTAESTEKALLLNNGPECTYDALPVSGRSEHEFTRRRTGGSPQPLVIQRPFGTTTSMQKVVILRGVIGGFGFVNYYYTLSTLPLGDATTLLSLYPIITIFLARIFLGEAIRSLHVAAATLSAAGAALISRPTFLFGNDADAEGPGPPALGYATALLGSICASGVIVLIRKAGRVGAHTLQLLFSWVVFGVSFSLLAGTIAGSSDAGGRRWRVPTREEAPSVLGVCVSGTVAHFLLNYAGRLVPATLAGLLRSSDIFWAYVLEIAVLGQRPRGETWLGAALVCSGLVLVLLSSNETKGGRMKHPNSVGNLTAAK